MSVTITGTLAQTQFNKSSISATIWETIIDGGINLLNTYGAGLSNLSGTAGSKTGTYTSAQAGAILTITQQIFSKHYINADNTTNANASLTLSYSNDNQLLTFASALARQLKNRAFTRTR